jgi:hypothetical protein
MATVPPPSQCCVRIRPGVFLESAYGANNLANYDCYANYDYYANYDRLSALEYVSSRLTKPLSATIFTWSKLPWKSGVSTCTEVWMCQCG